MMGLLQYKAKSQKPYCVECIKQILVSAASVCINRITAGYCSKATLLSDLLLLTKLLSSVILFIQTNYRRINLLL